MNFSTSQASVANSGTGGALGITPANDWRFEALLAAGVLAWAGSALGAPAWCPPEEDDAPGPGPAPASPAVDPTPLHAPQVSDDVRQWAQRHAADARALLQTGREHLTDLWETARVAAWGQDIAPDRVRLLVYGMGVEREASGSSGTSPAAGWFEYDAAHPGSMPRVVVLVHGLDESGFVWDDLAPALARAGMTPVRFDYPNDQPISRTTEQLAGALRRLHATGIRRIDLVGHSMGALAGRDLLTRPGLYAGDATGSKASGGDLPTVAHFIMLAAPNQGSPIAAMQPLSEAREQIARRIEGEQQSGEGWIRSTRDGRGEAADDLAAGSDYLRALNARPLPTGVKITNIVSRMVSSGERQRVRAALGRGLSDLLDADTARAVTGYVDDALDGLGDGLVSVDSMMLEGVSDTVEVKANHRSMIRRMRLGDDEPVGSAPPAVSIILNRLGESE